MTTIATDPELLEATPPPIGKPKILVVDDDQLVLKALEKTLEDPSLEILTAHSGNEALELLRHHEISVIICDQRMPQMSGSEVLKESIQLQRHAIRILLTGSGDLNTVVEAINIGQASQFIMKPWDETSLKHAVRNGVEKYRLRRENERLQKLASRQHAELRKNHEMLTQELRTGARIHEVMLLGKPPVDLPGIQVSAATIPSREIDGDFYDFYRPLPQLFDLVIGDVMGKGLPASLVGSAVKTQLTRFAVPFNRLHVLDRHGIWRDDVFSPQEIVQKVQEELSHSLLELEVFTCLLYARFDLEFSTLTFVDCGASKPLHYCAKSGQVSELTGDNFPLGVIEKESFSASEVVYEANDLFIFYSDGVTEARSPQNELYGVERLKQLVSHHAHQTPEQLLSTIKNSVISFAGKEQFDDDLTLITLRIDATRLPQFAKRSAAKFRADLSQAKAVREFIHRLCLQAPGDAERLCESLELAITEAFSNVVLHGQPGNEGKILLRGELVEEGVLLELSDQGSSFDPTQVPNPSFAGDRESGFGWYIIKEIADRVVYARKESETGWNHLKIYKQFIMNEGQMELSHDNKDGVLVVTLEGEHLDAKETPFFKQKVVDLLDNESVSRAVFDLHRLQFIDSSGLGAFLSILKILHGKGGDLKLAGMNRTIRTMFELVCMHKIFEIFNSPEEALRSFKG